MGARETQRAEHQLAVSAALRGTAAARPENRQEHRQREQHENREREYQNQSQREPQPKRAGERAERVLRLRLQGPLEFNPLLHLRLWLLAPSVSRSRDRNRSHRHRRSRPQRRDWLDVRYSRRRRTLGAELKLRALRRRRMTHINRSRRVGSIDRSA